MEEEDLFQLDDDDDDDGEWGFCVQLEQEERESEEKPGPNSPKTGIKISLKQTVTRGMNASDSETSLAAPSFPRIKSNSSFQELERAIGATLAMSFPDPEVHNAADISEVINHINGVISHKATLKKNLRQHIPMIRLRYESDRREKNEYQMRSDLLPFIEESDSRALIIFHSPDVIAFDIKSACQMFGSLYYFRSDFHSCGVTFLSYFDLRSAIDAKEKLSSRLGRLAKATVHSSIMLQPSASCHECSLRIHRVSNSKSEAFVEKIFSNYGPLRSIQRSFNDTGVKGTLMEDVEGNSTCDYTAEFYNIQDAKLAQAEMNSSSHNILGAEVVFVQLEKRVVRLKSALLNVLASWRIRMAEDESKVGGTEGKQRDIKPARLPIPTADINEITSFEDSSVTSMNGSVLDSTRIPQSQVDSDSPPPSTTDTRVEINHLSNTFIEHSHNFHAYNATLHNHPTYDMLPQGYIPYHFSSPEFNQLGYPRNVYPSDPMNIAQIPLMTINSLPSPAQVMQHPCLYGGIPFPHYATIPHPSSPTNIDDIYGGSGANMTREHQRSRRKLVNKRVSPSPSDARSRPPHHYGGHNKRNSNSVFEKNSKSGTHIESLSPQRIIDDVENRTTLMIRNIPNKYTQQMLLEAVNEKFEGLFDFFYLPIDFRNKCNVGYCFINFIDARDVVRFFNEFNNKRWRNFNSEKVCALSFARIQGKSAMITRYQNSSLMQKDSAYRPLLFFSGGDRKGQPESFLPGQYTH